MKSYVWLTFAFMGWAYYEMSGGADFEPQRPVIAAADEVEAEAPEIVTRASSPTLLAVSSSNMTTQPSDADILQAVTEAAALDAVDSTPDVIEIAAPVVEPVLDIRRVAGNRVNMRMGPSTDYDVITQLNGGAELEVRSVNDDGWANVSTVDRGIEGWIAARLLTAPET